MNKASYFAMGIVSLLLTGAGCQWGDWILVPPTTPAATSTTATILVSKAEGFCDGANMDSDGYRKTITQEKKITLPLNLTESERAKAIVIAATGDGMCSSVLRQLDVTVASGTLHIPPIDGWAGSSIVFCSCTPEVEVNALRIPGITKVQWGSAP